MCLSLSGENGGAVSTASHITRIPARRVGLACDDERTSTERHSGWWDGTRQNDSDDRTAGVSGVWEVRLGSTSDRRSNKRDAELGDGAEEVVSGVQDPHLLWFG